MSFKEGDKVRIISREVTEEDRKANRYYEHMAGLTGTVQNIYANNEYAVRADDLSLSKKTQSVHKEATTRMRTKLLESLSEVQKKELTKDELEFDVHFMLLVQGDDMVKA